MPAKEFVSKLFDLWEKGDSAPFFAALAPDVTWITRGNTPISGTYRGKDAYLEKVYKPLLAVFSGPTNCNVLRIPGDGDTVAVEWHGETPTTTGFHYSMNYCWLIRVREDGEAIQEVTGYYDTAMVIALLAGATPGSHAGKI
jgi:uncharacterized protein